MKKQLLFFGLFGCGVAFGQNLSQGFVVPGTLLPQEIFRFLPGFVGQLQSPSAGYTTNPTDRWFSMGQVSAGSQTFYGQRFQYDGRALVTGYTNALPNNPRIEWIHNGGSTAGNLEFRVANSFTGGASDLVASMTPGGNTYFGTNNALFAPLVPRVGISFNGRAGLEVISDGVLTVTDPYGIRISLSHNSNVAKGLESSVSVGETSIAVQGKAEGVANSFGVFGITSTTTQFGAAIYGLLPSPGPNLWAGYFDGDVFTTGFYLPSDAKLKENITAETNILDRISLLNPVSYHYKKMEGQNLPQGTQHGFISQEMAEVFPELTRDITKPVFDKDGKIVSELSFKAINYVGMISLLTEAVKELNVELMAVRQDLDEYKANDVVRTQLFQNPNVIIGYSIEQNVPNPFSEKTSIRFQLAQGVQSATLSIFNLNGAFVRDYSLEGNSGEIEILASEIGKGMYIYSLNQNGQEIISKRMIIK
jgi:hypothetical protein